MTAGGRLGSSGASPRLAGSLGVGYAFARHFSPTPPEPAIEAYRASFHASLQFAVSHVIVGVSVTCAETEARAEYLAASTDLMWVQFQRGEFSTIPSPDEALRYRYTPQEQMIVESNRARHFIGSASNAYISGWTDSSNFPTVAPLPITRGSGDAFIVLNSVGSTFAYSTYLGGSNGSEHAYGIAVDGAGAANVTGETKATNFPSAASLQATFGGSGSDAFVAKITAPPPAVLGPPTNLLATSIVGNTVTLSWTAPVNSITPTGDVLEGGISPGGVLASLPTNSAATSYTVSVPTGSFYIRMHSVAGGTRSVASNEIRIFVNVPAPPSAPANLLGLVNGSTLALAWTNTAGGGSPTKVILDVTGSLTLSLGLPVSVGFSFANVPAGTYNRGAFPQAGLRPPVTPCSSPVHSTGPLP